MTASDVATPWTLLRTETCFPRVAGSDKAGHSNVEPLPRCMRRSCLEAGGRHPAHSMMPEASWLRCSAAGMGSVACVVQFPQCPSLRRGLPLRPQTRTWSNEPLPCRMTSPDNSPSPAMTNFHEFTQQPGICLASETPLIEDGRAPFPGSPAPGPANVSARQPLHGAILLPQTAAAGRANGGL